MRRVPLPDACFRGELHNARRLIAQGHHVDTPDEFGWAPLHRAVESGNLEVLQLLLDNKADCDLKTPAESTAFHIAALHGYTDMAAALIAADEEPNINDENVNGSTPIMAAAFNASPAMIEMLLKQNADVSECDEDGWNPLHFLAWSAGKPGSAECASLLLEKNCDVMQKTSCRHAEDDSMLNRDGDGRDGRGKSQTASDIVRRRMVLMDPKERENANAMLEVLKKWEDVQAKASAKKAKEASDKDNFNKKLEAAKRRSSLEGRRSSLGPGGGAGPRGSIAGKEGRRPSKR